MKVLLLWTDCTTNEIPRPHLGYTYLIASLRERSDHEVALHIFYKRPSVEEVAEVVRRHDPDLIGATAVTSQWPPIRFIIESVRDAFPRIPIVVGGIHAAFAPSGVLRSPAVDMVCRGDGEATIVELANALQRGDPLDDVPNLVSKPGDGTRYAKPRSSVQHALPAAGAGKEWFGRNLDEAGYLIGPVRQPVQSLDDLPWADYSLFDMDWILSMNDGDFYHASTRGCPFSCTYCCSPSYANDFRGEGGKVVRRLSPDRIAAECRAARDRYPGMRGITLLDDVFAPPLSWLKRFAEVWPREVGVPLNVMLRPESARPELLELMRRAGVEDVMLGLEAGNERIRKEVLGRNTSTERVKKAFALCREYGMRTLAYVMVGVPGETEETLKDSYNLVKEIEPDFLTASTFFPFPGTPLYDLSLREGWIDIDPWTDDVPGDYYDRAWINHPNLSKDRITRAFFEVLELGAYFTARRQPWGTYDFMAHMDDATLTPSPGKRLRIGKYAASYPPCSWIYAPTPSSMVHDDVPIPEGAFLELTTGIHAMLDKPLPEDVFFEVFLDGARIFEHRADYTSPPYPEDRNWTEHRVDISRFAGQRVRIELRITSPDGVYRHEGVGWGRSQVNAPSAENPGGFSSANKDRLPVDGEAHPVAHAPVR